MDPILDKRLSAIEQKLTDTHLIVLKMRRAQRTASFIRALYWLFIILLGLGAFYFVQPYISQLKDAYGLGGGTSDSGNFQELYKQLNGQKGQ